MSFSCDYCGQDTPSLVVCGYCQGWRCYDCVEKEMTPLGAVIACAACRKERHQAIFRYPVPTCRICAWPKKVYGCDEWKCRHEPLVCSDD